MSRAYLRFLADNRRFLSLGFLMAWSSSFGQTYFISVFSGDIRAEFGLTHGDFGLVYSVATLVSGICLMWLGRQIDRFDLRSFSAAVCAALVAACVLTGWAETVVMLGVAMFALRIAGQGLMSHAALTSMARYFERDRGKAISIANLGFATGQAAFPIMGVALTAAVGWRQSWFVMAAVLALVLTPFMHWLLKGHGDRHREMMVRTSSSDGAGQAERRQWTLGEVRRDIRFWLIQPAVLALSFVGTGVIFHQVHLVESKGWSLAWFAGNFLVLAAVSVVTALITGSLIDRIGAVRLMPYFLIPSGLALALLASGDALILAPLFMVGTGIGIGMSRVVIAAIWAERYGVVHLGAIRALVAALMVIASALSPVIMGWLLDAGMAIDAMLLLCVAYYVVCIVLLVVAERPAFQPDAAAP